MAIRVIREIGDDILEKQCKAVPKMTLRTKILRQCMKATVSVLRLRRSAF